jgi:hypothetical protein
MWPGKFPCDASGQYRRDASGKFLRDASNQNQKKCYFFIIARLHRGATFRAMHPTGCIPRKLPGCIVALPFSFFGFL